MVKKNLERERTPEEQVASTSEKEQEKPTSAEEKPTLGRTYSEDEFRKAQSSWDSQISLQKAEAEQAKVQAERLTAQLQERDADYQSLQVEQDRLAAQQFAEDPEALRAYKDKKTLAEEKRQLARERAEATDAITTARKFYKAQALSKQYGIPVDDLGPELSETEMVDKTLEWLQNRPTKEAKPEEKEIVEETPTFDPAVSTARTGRLTVDAVEKMSPQERFEKAEEIAKMPLIQK